MQRYLSILCFVPLFILTLVHELGHVIAALLLRARVHSIRVLGLEARIRGRRRGWWRKSISLRARRYRAHHYGQVEVTFHHGSPSPMANLFFSSAGYVMEWALLGWCWSIIRAHPAQQGYSLIAFFWLVLISTFNTFKCTLSDARGEDLYEVRRSLRAIVRRVQRA
jgi:hypothetical protein